MWGCDKVIPFDVPNLRDLGLPQSIEAFVDKPGIRGGDGTIQALKSTTLAALVELINSKRNCHVMTIEDHRVLHKPKKAIVNQREIGEDAKSFPSALQLRAKEDPDVILVGEMRDLETIAAAMLQLRQATWCLPPSIQVTLYRP